MRVLFSTLGSRGDMEPFLALARIFCQQGHEVKIALPEQYLDLAEAAGFPPASRVSLGSRFMEVLFGEEGKILIDSKNNWKNRFRSFPAAYRFYRAGRAAMEEVMTVQEELFHRFRPHRVISHFLPTYAFLWEHLHPRTCFFYNPFPYFIHTVPGHPPVGIKKDRGIWGNRIAYAGSRILMAMYIRRLSRYTSRTSWLTFRESLRLLKTTPVLYGVSPSLFTPPSGWPTWVRVTGFLERIYFCSVPSGLNKFLRGRKVIFLTFGSLVSARARIQTDFFLKVLIRMKIPSVIATGKGGLIKPEKYSPQQFFFLSEISYTWLFPRVYAVIHHGGSGTTQMGLKYGCPTLVIPHILDQFIWGEMVFSLGVGPSPIPVQEVLDSESRLERAIEDLYSDPDYRERAEFLGKKMREEDEKIGYNMITS